MSRLQSSDRNVHVAGRVPAWVLSLIAGMFLASALFIYKYPPKLWTILVHPVARLGCNLTDQGVAKRTAVAIGDVTGPTPAAPTDWGAIKQCLDGMAIEKTKGEKDHAMVPFGGAAAPSPIAVSREQYDTASIYPRKNIWWDDRPDMGDPALHSARVMARVESRHGYDRLGFIPGNNYIVVWFRGERMFMAVINEQGAKRIGDPQPEYKKHGAVAYNGVADTPPPPNIHEKPDPMGGLSASALQCVHADLKACFIDSKDVWRAGSGVGAGSGFGIGMPVRDGSTEPWMACATYGCCCGGHRCHNDI